MSQTRSFRDLEVWQYAMTLVERIYAVSKRFPPEERFCLAVQLRRAAVSIPSNIGEGNRRRHLKAYLNHLDIAMGSQAEVEVQMDLARRLGYCSAVEHESTQEQIERVGRMLNGLIRALNRRAE